MSPTEFVRTRYALAFDYARADLGVLAVAIVATALPQILADAFLDEQDALRISALLGLVQLYINLLVTFRTLDHVGAAPPGYQRADLTEARFPTAFGMSLLSSVAVLIGLILLVIPGVLLLLLWSLALPAIAARRARSVEALRISWRLARPALGPLALIAVPLVGTIIAAVLFVVVIAVVAPDAKLPASIVMNLVFSSAITFMASVWTFAYLALREGSAAA